MFSIGDTVVVRHSGTPVWNKRATDDRYRAYVEELGTLDKTSVCIVVDIFKDNKHGDAWLYMLCDRFSGVVCTHFSYVERI